MRARQDHQYNGQPADVVLAHIKDVTSKANACDICAPAQTAVKQPFHTDVGDIVSLFALGESEEGGQSYLSSGLKVYNELAAARPDLIRTLAEPWAFDEQVRTSFVGTHHWHPGSFSMTEKGFEVRPLLHYQPATAAHPERLIIHYSRRDFTGFDKLPRSPHIPLISEAQAEALDSLNFTAERYAASIDFHKGDIQYVNNLCILHGRGAFKDSPDKQ
jgi:hypothetical protein